MLIPNISGTKQTRQTGREDSHQGFAPRTRLITESFELLRAKVAPVAGPHSLWADGGTVSENVEQALPQLQAVMRHQRGASAVAWELG